jgi:S-adenosylmethionine hydrolase
LTDFGLTDSYVAEMKAVLLDNCPAARIVDVTHHVPPQDVHAASIILERVLRSFPPRTIHVAVVDPGVGTDRRLLLADVNRQHILCPDNGLITWPWRRLGGKAHLLKWKSAGASATFHGRDLLVPAAAHLASRRASLKGPRIDPVLLDLHPANPPAQPARIIYIDHFGNAVTNIPAEAHLTRIQIGRRTLPLRRTYADVRPGQPLALIGSSGLVEIALRNGNAAAQLRLKVGQPLTIDN